MKKELIFLGPPACGKGTQTNKLSEYLGFPHIDTGSLLRAEIAKETEEGLIAKSFIDDGFDCTSIKAIRSYGATADLCYLLDVAFAHQDIKYVFYNLDPSALSADPAGAAGWTSDPQSGAAGCL